jgi:peptidoglycan hydrolase FlgJ
MDARVVPNASSLDPAALGALRGRARADDPKALEAAARQFESLFLNQLLKSMREAQVGSGEDGLFDSHEQRTFTSLLDEQMANRIANGRGIGLADMLIAQIGRSRDLLASQPPAAAEPVKNPAPAPLSSQGG